MAEHHSVPSNAPRGSHTLYTPLEWCRTEGYPDRPRRPLQHPQHVPSHSQSGVQQNRNTTASRVQSLPHAGLPPSAPSTEQPGTPQTPQLASPSSDEQLRGVIVRLLSENANACIAELGYPTQIINYQKLYKDYKPLREENAKLKDDNHRLAHFAQTQAEDHKKREANAAQVVKGLQARIAELERNQDLLKRQCDALLQARSLSATDSYKILEAKYNYVLQILPRCGIQLPSLGTTGKGVDRASEDREQTAITDPSGTNLIDLTASPNLLDMELPGPLLKPTQQISDPNSDRPQFIQGSSFCPLQEMQHNLQSTTVPAPSSSSLPSLTAEPVSTNSSVSISLSTAGTVSEGLDTGEGGAKGKHAALQAHDTNTVRVGAPMRSSSVVSHSQVQAPSYTASSAPPATGMSMPDKLPLSRYWSPQPKSASAPPTVSSLIPETNYQLSHAVVQAPKGAHRASSASITNRFASALAESSPHVQSAEQYTSTTPKEETRPDVELTIEPQIVPKHASSSLPTPISAQPEEETHPVTPNRRPPFADAQPTGIDEGSSKQPISQFRAQTPMRVPQSPAPLPSSGEVSMQILGSNETQAGDVEIDIAERENTEIDTRDTVMVPTETEGGEQMEEEDADEPYDDLTDDEDGKLSVLECISAIFLDDDDDGERYCKFCNARLRRLELPDPRPAFSDCSLRDLIQHGKGEHQPVWERLRRTRPE